MVGLPAAERVALNYIRAVVVGWDWSQHYWVVNATMGCLRGRNGKATMRVRVGLVPQMLGLVPAYQIGWQRLAAISTKRGDT